MKKMKLLVMAITSAIYTAGASETPEFEVTHRFEANTPALASEVNENFEEIANQLNINMGNVNELSATQLTTHNKLIAVESETVEVKARIDSTAGSVNELANTQSSFSEQLEALKAVVANGPGNEDFADLTQRLSTLESASTPLIVTSDNHAMYQSQSIDERFAIIEGNLTIEATYDKTLKVDNGIFLGGSFTASPVSETESQLPTLEIGTDSVIIGASFSNLKLEGSNITCIRCTFRGDITFSTGIKLDHSLLEDVAQNTVTSIEHITNSDIRNSQLTRVENIESSDIKDSVIGSTEHLIQAVLSSRIDDSDIYLSGRLLNNVLDDSWIEVGNRRNIIANNIFDDMQNGKNEYIHFNLGISGYRYNLLSGNVFDASSSSPRHIFISGENSSPHNIIVIKDNQFIKANTVLEVDTSQAANIVVKDNELYQTSLNYAGSNVTGNITL
ncbi:hypothetical protein [Pseudoalteromonas rubra]|uniref:hypothetical protein n=1 Tax=Pseudoalteromonas rubra TaxID=43658 RepID=UPI002DC00755|nr:hypothetical protein [Pseudoalteromonas rubra]MEC4089307.1 hypothetical protein [Pseudoalteromonas rubra]